MAKRTTRSSKKQLREITSSLSDIKVIQTQEINKTESIDSTVNAVLKKLDLITGIIVRNSVRVATLKERVDVLDDFVFTDEFRASGGSEVVDKPTLSIVNSMVSLAKSLASVNRSLGSMTEPALAEAYQMEAASAVKPSPAATGRGTPGVQESEKQEGVFGLLKSLFTNPAVVAALAGIVYTILPKDIQDKIKSFLGGFATGLEDAVGKNEESGLKGLSTALKIAAGVIAVVFGAKLLNSIADAITTTVKIFRLMGGKGGKKLLAVGAVAAVGAAGYMIARGKDKEGDEVTGDTGKPEGSTAAEPVSKPATAATQTPTTPPAAAPSTPPPPPAAGDYNAPRVAPTAAGAAGDYNAPRVAPTAAPAAGDYNAPRVAPTVEKADMSAFAAYEKAVRTDGRANVMSNSTGAKASKGNIGVKLPDEKIGDVIRTASKKVGVEESIMLAMAKQESGFNPDAKAGTSSAKGLYQFINKTWDGMVEKYGKVYPELAAGPMDALASAIAGALFIKENSQYLKKNNIPINGTNIYAAHFLGPGGARILLSADPNTLGSTLMPGPAAANKNIFFKKDGSPNTIGEIINILYGKVGAAAEKYAALLNGTPSPAPGTALAAAPVAPTPTTGSAIASASQSVKTLSQPTTQVASVSTNKTSGMGGGTQTAYSPIPSPIANRGSLIQDTRHMTAA